MRLWAMLALLCFTTAAGLSAAAAAGGYDESNNILSVGKCERITVPLCKDVPYNYTRLPNMLGHYDQERILMDVQHFEPLVHTGCSPHVKFFVCSIYTPMCSENVDVAITSCRSVCEQVKASCMSILTRFGLTWPDMLECDRFPKAGELCMEPMAGASHPAPVGSPNGRLYPNAPSTGPMGGGRGSSSTASRCPADMVEDPSVASASAALPGNVNDAWWTAAGRQCAPLCHRPFMFHQQHKEFAGVWMGAWASLCLIVTAFTVVTYWLQPQRFRYPERAIIHLAACYHLCSWVYVLRAFVLSAGDVACTLDPRTGDQYLIGNGFDKPACALSFIVLYYFTMASSLWWVVLTLTWFLSASRKWGVEAIEQYSSAFLFVAWGLPALLAITVLISRKVDASELTAVCYVGQSDWRALVGFVVTPLAVLLLVGCGFILAGFVGMCSVRRKLIISGTDPHKLEKLMVKIGVFSLLYIMPAVCVLACEAYHAYVLAKWEPSTTRHVECVMRSDPAVDCDSRPPMPKAEVYMLKIFMSLVVGITSGMWVTSRKTCLAWARSCCCPSRCCWLDANDAKAPPPGWDNGQPTVVAGDGRLHCAGAPPSTQTQQQMVPLMGPSAAGFVPAATAQAHSWYSSSTAGGGGVLPHQAQLQQPNVRVGHAEQVPLNSARCAYPSAQATARTHSSRHGGYRYHHHMQAPANSEASKL